MIEKKNSRVLVLGASGMLGNAVLRFLAFSERFTVVGSVRSTSIPHQLPKQLHENVIPGVDIENIDSLTRLFGLARPDFVINCIGLIKQLAGNNDPLAAIPLNAIFPHRLARLCEVAGARLIHISTDCVFSGSKGMYDETDPSDAPDLYGRTKYLGEVDYPHAITLRTSIIGHELASAKALVGWFLSQAGPIKGFKRVIFSGLPTVEIARIIRDHVIPNPELHGVYHLSAEPINKFDLLTLIAEVYKKEIEIISDDKLVIDRSLNSNRFRSATGFQPRPWQDMVRDMRDFG